MAQTRKIAPVHPGEILMMDVLEPLGLSQNQFASMLGVPANRINAIVRGHRSISADTAVRLAKCLGSTPDFWMGLQAEYDLQMAQDALEQRLDDEVTVLSQTKAT
jgi:addiction module HigA family antidote